MGFYIAIGRRRGISRFLKGTRRKEARRFDNGRVRKKGLLLTSRERRRDKLWFTWDAIDAKFERNFELLLALVAREGHADVPKRHVVEDGEKL